MEKEGAVIGRGLQIEFVALYEVSAPIAKQCFGSQIEIGFGEQIVAICRLGLHGWIPGKIKEALAGEVDRPIYLHRGNRVPLDEQGAGLQRAYQQQVLFRPLDTGTFQGINGGSKQFQGVTRRQLYPAADGEEALWLEAGQIGL